MATTDKTFDQIMIDPPYPKRKGGLRQSRPNQGRVMDYKTMAVDEIFELIDAEILTMASPIHNVWLWSIDSFLRESEGRMAERGYKMHARIIWDKLNGTAPAFTVRYSHEYLLWFYKPKLQPVAKESRGKLRTVLQESSRQHSRKPEMAYRMVEFLYPDSNRIDVFSRERREGWSQYGDEVNHFKNSGGVASDD